LLAVRVLNGGIVLINEVILDELDGKSGLADTSSSNNKQLVLCHILTEKAIIAGEEGKGKA